MPVLPIVVAWLRAHQLKSRGPGSRPISQQCPDAPWPTVSKQRPHAMVPFLSETDSNLVSGRQTHQIAILPAHFQASHSSNSRGAVACVNWREMGNFMTVAVSTLHPSEPAAMASSHCAQDSRHLCCWPHALQMMIYFVQVAY